MNMLASHRSAGVAVDTENREKDDFYPTPPHATEALLDRETFEGMIWEPACGDGAISQVLKGRGYHVESTDLVDRGYGVPRVDFLMEFRGLCPNIITNPPYKYCTEFAWKALDLATAKVAFLCRLQFLESLSRRALFEAFPPARVWVFSERVKIYRGRQATEDDGGGMIPQAWFVWDKAHKGATELGWI